MDDEQLATTDSEDIADVLRQLESSFALKFGIYELQNVKTFGELCDIVVSKILLTDAQDCTAQQAFYKIRKAFEASTGQTSIIPASPLAGLLPKRGRKRIWHSVEHQLGIKLAIIGLSSPVVILLLLAFLGAFAAFFISASAGGIGLSVATLAAIIAGKTENTLQVTTVRELAEKMTREQYAKSRRNSATFNRKEISPLIQAIFMDRLSIPASALHREATFS